MVVTWYLSSLFMGHATADVVVHFENCAVGLHLNKLYELSMEGPDESWKCLGCLRGRLRRSIIYLLSTLVAVVNTSFTVHFVMVQPHPVGTSRS